MHNHNQSDLLVSGIEGWTHGCACTLFLWIRNYIAYSSCQSIHTPSDKATGKTYSVSMSTSQFSL